MRRDRQSTSPSLENGHRGKNTVTGHNNGQEAELKTLNSVRPINMCEIYLLNLMNNVCSVLSPVSFEQECCVIPFSCVSGSDTETALKYVYTHTHTHTHYKHFRQSSLNTESYY